MTLTKPICLLLSFLIVGISSTAQISKRDIRKAQDLYGLTFSKQAIDTMHQYLHRNLEGYDTMRNYSLPHETFPAIIFNPHPRTFRFPDIPDTFTIQPISSISLPEQEEEVAFYTIPQLAALLQSKQITSTELTQLYLKRLKKYNPTLQCAITITEELALEQARKETTLLLSLKN